MKQVYYTIIFSAVIVFSSCNDWLHVDSNSKKEAEDFLSTEIGFQNALIGLYLDLKTNKLYGNEMTMGRLEYLVGTYVPKEKNQSGTYIYDFNYLDSGVEKIIDDIFLGLYSIIVQANQILEVIDNKQDVFSSEDMYKLIKAEALGIRAYCHLDVLRLFGPIPKDATGENILPYVKTVSKYAHEYVNFNRFMELLLEDLTFAEELLEDIDPINEYSLIQQFNVVGYGLETFWGYRQTRMNYNAVCGLKARAYLWADNKENALIYSRKVIDAVYGSSKTKTYSLGTQNTFQAKDNLILSSEHVFALEVYNIESLVIERFRNDGSGNFQSSRNVVGTIYDITDVRYNFVWGEEEDTSKSKNKIFTLGKYLQAYNGSSSISLCKIPLIRLSEMYLIAIECGDSEADELYSFFCGTRDATEMDLDNMENVIKYEYNREFVGEGQIFYMYKRLKSSNMLLKGDLDISYLTDIYVFPLPKAELY